MPGELMQVPAAMCCKAPQHSLILHLDRKTAVGCEVKARGRHVTSSSTDGGHLQPTVLAAMCGWAMRRLPCSARVA
jgi:hypothetical protein